MFLYRYCLCPGGDLADGAGRAGASLVGEGADDVGGLDPGQLEGARGAQRRRGPVHRLHQGARQEQRQRAQES